MATSHSAERHDGFMGNCLFARIDGPGGSASGVDALLLEGGQRFDVRDWGLQPPRLGLLKVQPDIDVRVRLVAHPS